MESMRPSVRILRNYQWTSNNPNRMAILTESLPFRYTSEPKSLIPADLLARDSVPTGNLQSRFLRFRNGNLRKRETTEPRH
jgi:hypothetical protein